MNEDALVGPQVAKVKQHHEGSDVVHGEGRRLLEAHALWDEEGVVHRHHRHLLPQPKAAQHHHLITDLEQKARDETGNNARNFSGFIPLSTRTEGILKLGSLYFFAYNNGRPCKHAATKPQRVCSWRAQANKQTETPHLDLARRLIDFMEEVEEFRQNKEEAPFDFLFNGLDVQDWSQSTTAVFRNGLQWLAVFVCKAVVCLKCNSFAFEVAFEDKEKLGRFCHAECAISRHLLRQ